MGSANQDYSDWARNFFAMGNQPTSVVAPAKSGLMSGLNNLFQNKLFLQLLSAAGTDLMGKQPGTATNAVVQQNISSQNYAKLLSRMLAGDIPEGASIQHTDAGTTIKMPREHLESESKPGGGLANPFASSQSGFSASDLAGVSPEMISQALQLKQNQEQLAQRSFSDVMRAMYEGGMLGVAERNAATAEVNAATDTANAISTRMRAEADWLNLGTTEKTKNYEYAVRNGYEGTFAEFDAGKTAQIQNYEFAKQGGFKGTFDEFANPSDTSQQRNYEYAVKGGYKGTFVQYQKELASAGATRISLGEKVAEKLALSEVEARTQLDDPRQLQGAIDNALSAKDIISSIRLADTPDEAAKIKARETVKAIEGMIATGKGVVTEAYIDKDGRTGVWVVQWPNGDVRTYRHAIK